MDAESWARLSTKTDLIKLVIQNNLHNHVPEWRVANIDEFLSRDDYKSEPIAKSTKIQLAQLLLDGGVVRVTKRKIHETIGTDVAAPRQLANRKRKIEVKMDRLGKLARLVMHQKEQMNEPNVLKAHNVDGNYQIDDIVINNKNIAIGINNNGNILHLTSSDVNRCLGERILYDNLRIGNL